MRNWITFYCLLVFVNAQPTSTSGNENEVSDECNDINCIGEEYECIEGICYCADGFISNHFHTRCIPCPGLGDQCFAQERCCNTNGNKTLHCWKGTCQPCYDELGNWICRESLDQILLISSTQIVMGAALVLGIIVTFVLIYKLCAATNLRAFGTGTNDNSRLSIGSLQMYVEERLRDAPPRYSRTPAAESATYPPAIYLNAGFIHDSSVPPPPYSPPERKEENQSTALHI